MKIPKEVQCKTCGQVFCCAKCRQKHEDNSHQEMKAIRQICYICNNRPFPLRTDTKITPNNLLVQHIINEHLPLQCNRCTKVFATASDLKTLARCKPFAENNTISMEHACNLERSPRSPGKQRTSVENSKEMENKENIDQTNRTDTFKAYNGDNSGNTIPTTAIKPKSVLPPVTISKELLAITDPIEEIEEPNEALLTPLTKINLRWKRKSRLSFDSMNASNNISAVITSETGRPSPAKKMARTTSTPMIGSYIPKMQCSNESNTSALGQMSSIHSSGSDSDSRNDDQSSISPTSYELEKVRAIVKSRSKAAATPLRQVMSKSIQRAIAQHTHYSKMVVPGTQRKMSFNSTGGSEANSGTGSPSRKALDLRTTPALKRSSSEISVARHNEVKTACISKAQSEDFINYPWDDISRPTSEYYETHQNEASLDKSNNADQENRENHKIVKHSMINSKFLGLKALPSYYQDTPKIAGAMLKKAISFTTPEMTQIGIHHEDADETTEVWATPCSIPPRSFSCSALQDTGLKPIVYTNNDSTNQYDDVFLPSAKINSHHKSKKESSAAVPSTGKLWTIVSNVIRLASRTDIREDLATDSPEYSSGSDSGSSTFSSNLVQKAQSFAGFLRNRLPGRQTTCTSSELDESPPLDRSGTKRKRTAYTRPYETIGSTISMRTTSSPLAKRKRIQGRQPIERMRKGSRDGNVSDV